MLLESYLLLLVVHLLRQLESLWTASPL
ncbi:hypothetical protein NC652_019557 [Populus alba x Populus x berolinensis]|nr:hypothetical protein NC652_019549 [Populus alba x Populus x berolinensis]KAJ6917216.1 hypothetical protein NC652_019557 [Populus alba x Populus x berolinensis]